MTNATNNVCARLGRERRAKLLWKLTELAARGAPMLTNRQILDVIDADKESAPVNCLAGLVRTGAIRLAHSPCGLRRRVTIVTTGQATDWQPARYYKRSGVEKRVKPKPEGALRSVQFRAASLDGRGSGYADSILYGADAAYVRALRRAGDAVWIERGLYKVNGRFELDSAGLRTRAQRYGAAAIGERDGG